MLRNSSVCFGCFDLGSKHRNKPKLFDFGFTIQTETNAKQILFRFVSVRTEIFFCLFRGHPKSAAAPGLPSISAAPPSPPPPPPPYPPSRYQFPSYEYKKTCKIRQINRFFMYEGGTSLGNVRLVQKWWISNIHFKFRCTCDGVC